MADLILTRSSNIVGLLMGSGVMLGLLIGASSILRFLQIWLGLGTISSIKSRAYVMLSPKILV